MPRLQLLGLLAIFCCALNLATANAQPAGGRTPADETRYQGRTIADWIKDWDQEDFPKTQAAIRALAAAGEPAAFEMARLIKQRHRHIGHAVQTLGKMGEPARAALPTLLELASDKSAANPEGWTSSVSLRSSLLSEAKNMPWAADEWIPVLQRVAGDETEVELNRLRALHALGDMGAKATTVLREFATNKDNAVRKAATQSLVDLAVAAGRTKADAYEDIIDRNPFDANVPDYLVSMQGRSNNESPNPVTQRVKAALRKRLQEKPDAEIALELATIIQNSLANTDLEFAAPTDSLRSQYSREDPAENYTTLAEALEIGLANAAKDSDLARRLGIALARLRLLQGDWDGMNAALEEVGQQPVHAELRAKLPAPPGDWSNVRKDWPTDNKDMQAGTAAIELEFEKDGKGFAGAHVLIKRRVPAENFSTAIRTDTLLLATRPLGKSSLEAFGYYASDRAQTRYAVTGASGKVRIENLPAIPIAVEVLIPASNFSETARKWDLMIETSPGEIRRTWIEASSTRGSRPSLREVPRPDARQQILQVSRTAGPAVVELKANETLKYPKFIVRTQLLLNVTDWASVDPSEFVLFWGAVSGEERFDHYEVEMMLTAPQQSPTQLPSQRAIRSAIVETTGTHWNVGSDGVGGLRLRPGNIYMFEVRAVDRDKRVLTRLPATRVWVPWTQRKSQSPNHEPGAISRVPIYDGVGWRSSTQVFGQPRVELPERIEKYLAAGGNSFELEYVQLGNAWLQCLTSDVEAGRKEITRLAETLPEGNVVRGTARALLKQLEAGQELPKRLDFVADE